MPLVEHKVPSTSFPWESDMLYLIQKMLIQIFFYPYLSSFFLINNTTFEPLFCWFMLSQVFVLIQQHQSMSIGHLLLLFHLKSSFLQDKRLRSLGMKVRLFYLFFYQTIWRFQQFLRRYCYYYFYDVFEQESTNKKGVSMFEI